MGYSGARGGLEAILAAERLSHRAREHADCPPLTQEQIRQRLRLAVDRVMGEGGLYDEDTAAAALRQAEGDLLEATHLVRAHRSTLERLAVSEPVDPDEMAVLRRIVPAYRTPDGPQLLGRTTDYTPRRLGYGASAEAGDPSVADHGDAGARAANSTRSDGTASHDANGGTASHDANGGTASSDANGGTASHDANGGTASSDAGSNGAVRARTDSDVHPGRFSKMLRELDLLVEHELPDAEPFDITRQAPRPPAPRSAVLATMARAETGALVGIWYRSILGPDGDIHEVTLGEVRHGRLPVRVTHPLTGNPVQIGAIRATETEAIEDLDGAEEDRSRFDIGYGMCFGHNERKAIAMANLDIACRRFGRTTALEQVLLLTTDGLDSGGFLEHLKLPHYVTFRSMVERKQAVRAAAAENTREPEPIGRTC